MIKLKCKNDDEYLKKIQSGLHVSVMESIALLKSAKDKSDDSGMSLENVIDDMLKEGAASD